MKPTQKQIDDTVNRINSFIACHGFDGVTEDEKIIVALAADLKNEQTEVKRWESVAETTWKQYDIASAEALEAFKKINAIETQNVAMTKLLNDFLTELKKVQDWDGGYALPRYGLLRGQDADHLVDSINEVLKK